MSLAAQCGADLRVGQGSDDTITAGTGNDTLVRDSGADDLKGQGGTDTSDYNAGDSDTTDGLIENSLSAGDISAILSQSWIDSV